MTRKIKALAVCVGFIAAGALFRILVNAALHILHYIVINL